MSNKSQVFDKFKEYVAENGTPGTLRTDNGAELKQEFTVLETPAQNGVAGRFNRTIVEMGRCLLIQAKLSEKYWVRALDTDTYIRNLTVSANSNEGKSPFELFTGKTVPFEGLIQDQLKQSSLATTATVQHTYYKSSRRRKYKARNVLFEENKIQPFSPKEEVYQGAKILESPNLDLRDEQLNEKPVGGEVG